MELTGSGLTCARVHTIAYGGAEVTLGSLDAAWLAYEVAQDLLGPVYGQTTGVGANKSVEVAEGGHDLLRSHATGAGPLVGPERTRAMLAVRLNQLLAGGSGVDPRLLPVLAEAVNGGAVPPVRTYGAIGTGDLTALSVTALCLLGEIPWDGPRFPLASSDALPFISSGAATLADAALACHRLTALLDAAVVVAARSFRAVNASAEPLALVVQEARRQPGQAIVAARLRDMLAAEPVRIQDPYGFRAFAQVHGTAVAAASQASRTVEIDLDSATENPLIADDLAWHNGNFHAAAVAHALDGLRTAVATAAQLSTARLAAMMDPALTGRLPFLAAEPGGNGALILEYVAQDALAELRHLAGPVSVGTAVISRGTEDHASFATQAARLALRCVEPLEVVFACEAVAADLALGEPGPDRPLDHELDTARENLRTSY
ncbi:aromatic amino acid ammonia-lyase [Nonomuraea soli]|uniref:Histidine ammonia-lyase n=1 Tax=Nonomuraea soli TaxID=1032476 RepID=A0A7W0CMI0_9ACTN|nr:aromatic amino acid ammonia-lyase [Nonomuraea soli]MBA2893923.1 histidine ammonia-lyase [Nonomuraea soli]